MSCTAHAPLHAAAPGLRRSAAPTSPAPEGHRDADPRLPRGWWPAAQGCAWAAGRRHTTKRRQSLADSAEWSLQLQHCEQTGNAQYQDSASRRRLEEGDASPSGLAPLHHPAARTPPTLRHIGFALLELYERNRRACVQRGAPDSGSKLEGTRNPLAKTKAGRAKVGALHESQRCVYP